MILASHTGWGLNELLELDIGELREWLRALEAAQPRMPR